MPDRTAAPILHSGEVIWQMKPHSWTHVLVPQEMSPDVICPAKQIPTMEDAGSVLAHAEAMRQSRADCCIRGRPHFMT